MHVEVSKLTGSILNKQDLSQASVSELEQLVARYPFFTGARLLYLKKLQQEESPSFETELQQADLWLPNTAWIEHLFFNTGYAVETASNGTNPTQSVVEEIEVIHQEPETLAAHDQLPVAAPESDHQSVAEPVEGYNNEPITPDTAPDVTELEIIPQVPEAVANAGPSTETTEVTKYNDTHVADQGRTNPAFDQEPPFTADHGRTNPAFDEEPLITSDHGQTNPAFNEEPLIEAEPGQTEPPAADGSSPDQEIESTSLTGHHDRQSEEEDEGSEESAETDIEMKLPAFHQEPVDLNQELTFEPFHTVDYFASQGIQARDEEKPADRFSQQLRSFTQWLKTMKKIPAGNDSVPPILEEKTIEKMAEHSIQGREVVTEAMAEVWIKQGNTARAREVYQKLSLLDPDKSTYFAAKIEHLK